MTQSQALAKPKSKLRYGKLAVARSAAKGQFVTTKKPSGPELRTEARGLKFPFVPVAKS